MANNAKWQAHLLKELPLLEQEAVIDEATATRLKEYCRRQLESQTAKSGNYLLTLLSCIGALLIAAAIVLFFNYNWYFLGKRTQIAISFLPLLTGALLSIYTLARSKGRPWREVCALWNMAGTATAIALLSHIYQVNGSLSDFTVLLLLTTLPVIYIFDGLAAAAAYNFALFMTLGDVSWHAPITLNSHISIVLVLGTLPLLISHIRKERAGIANLCRNMLLVPAYYIILAVHVHLHSGSCFPTPLVLPLAILFLIGGLIRKDASPEHRWNLWLVLGGITTSAIILCASHPEVANECFEQFYYENSAYGNAFLAKLYTIVCHAAACALIVWQLVRARRASRLSIRTLFPAIILFIELLFDSFLALVLPDAITAAVFSLVVIAWSIVLLYSGFQRLEFREMNAGLLLLLILATIHFFNSSMGVLLRSGFFLLAGLLFIAANAVTARRMKNRQSPTAIATEETNA